MYYLPKSLLFLASIFLIINPLLISALPHPTLKWRRQTDFTSTLPESLTTTLEGDGVQIGNNVGPLSGGGSQSSANVANASENGGSLTSGSVMAPSSGSTGGSYGGDTSGSSGGSTGGSYGGDTSGSTSGSTSGGTSGY